MTYPSSFLQLLRGEINAKEYADDVRAYVKERIRERTAPADVPFKPTLRPHAETSTRGDPPCGPTES